MSSENRIAKMRKLLGYSQAQLAEMMGVAQNTISNWEKGSREPNYETLKKLSRLFNCTIDDLIGEEDSILLKNIDNYPIPASEKEKLRSVFIDSPENIERAQLSPLIAKIASELGEGESLASVVVAPQKGKFYKKRFTELSDQSKIDVGLIEIYLNSIRKALEQLNQDGQAEAVNRIKELTEISKYRRIEQKGGTDNGINYEND